MQQLVFGDVGRYEWRDAADPQITDGRQAIVRPIAVACCDLDVGVAQGVLPMAPGNGAEMARPHPDAAPRPYSCFHLAIATERSVDEIIAIGEREGWRAVPCSRGGVFDVVELWLENGLMFEVLTPEMQHSYRTGVTIDMWRFNRHDEPVPA